MTQAVALPLVIWEDELWRRFLPLSWLRSLAELRCGIFTGMERLHQLAPTAGKFLLTRDWLKDTLTEKYPTICINVLPNQESILISARLLLSRDIWSAIMELGKNEGYVLGDEVVAARGLSHQLIYQSEDGWAIDGEKLQTKSLPNAYVFQHIWEVMTLNKYALFKDFDLFTSTTVGDNHLTDLPAGVYLEGEGIWIENHVELGRCVVIDSREGPVVIDKGAKIMPNSVIIGPAYIGTKSLIKINAKIYGPVSIGPVCKVGGEVDGSVILAYSNKQHEGFLGHSYLCEWVNIGADTNTSDLKNNYSSVRIMEDGELVDTGELMIGTLMADHSKTGINATLTTGSVVGVGCNLFGTELFPRYIPSFSWGIGSEFAEHKYDKFLATAQRVMLRRDKKMSAAEEKLFFLVYEKTEGERRRFGVKPI